MAGLLNGGAQVSPDRALVMLMTRRRRLFCGKGLSNLLCDSLALLSVKSQSTFTVLGVRSLLAVLVSMFALRVFLIVLAMVLLLAVPW